MVTLPSGAGLFSKINGFAKAIELFGEVANSPSAFRCFFMAPRQPKLIGLAGGWPNSKFRVRNRVVFILFALLSRNIRQWRLSGGRFIGLIPSLRDLGPVKGMKGVKQHEVVADFTLRGLLILMHGMRPGRRPSFVRNTGLEDRLHRQTSADDGLRR